MALDFPASPSNGQVFTSGGVSWTFDGDKWKVSSSSIEPVFISSSTPTGVAGQIYWDSDESTAYIYYNDGNTAQWVPLVSTAPVSFDTSAIVSGTLPVARGGTGTTSFDAGKIAEGNTEAEVVDTGSDGHFKVTTEGTERFKIDSSGRLLVGTTTEGEPNAENLTIADSGNCGLTLRSGSSNVGSIYFSDATSGNGEYDGYIDYIQNTSSMRFGTASTTRVVIDSSGNFGIGTTSPSSTLHVNGTITDSIGPVRQLGITNHNASTLTLAATHAGNLIREATNGANITLPSGVFSAGDMITIFNVSSGDNTITQGSSVTLYNTADAATGNRTLAAKGVCTIACTSSNEFIISGSGLS